jgi:hypothetical protein
MNKSIFLSALIAYGINATKLQSATEIQTAAHSDDIAVKYFNRNPGEAKWKKMPNLNNRKPYKTDVLPKISNKV